MGDETVLGAAMCGLLIAKDAWDNAVSFLSE